LRIKTSKFGFVRVDHGALFLDYLNGFAKVGHGLIYRGQRRER